MSPPNAPTPTAPAAAPALPDEGGALPPAAARLVALAAPHAALVPVACLANRLYDALAARWGAAEVEPIPRWPAFEPAPR